MRKTISLDKKIDDRLRVLSEAESIDMSGVIQRLINREYERRFGTLEIAASLTNSTRLDRIAEATAAAALNEAAAATPPPPPPGGPPGAPVRYRKAQPRKQKK